MKTIHRFFCAIGVALATLFGSSGLQAVEPPVRILPLGDSLTAGLSTYPVPGAYRNRLYTLLTGAGYNVDFVGTFTDSGNPTLPDINHQGIGSYRIDQIQSNLTGWLNAVEDPDVVLLLIGTNDIWANYDVANAPARLSSLINDISNQRPFAKIIVANLPLRTDNATIEASQVNFSSKIPGIVAQQVALGHQVTYVDMHSALAAGDLSPDGVHPTATGYSKMGDVWFPGIAGVISTQGTSNRPLIAKIGPMVDLNHVPVIFSKPVSDSSANPANFTLSGGLTVSGATLDATTKRIVTLTTSTQTPGIVYQVTVNGVKDRTPSMAEIAPGSKAAFSSSALVNGSFENDYSGWTTTGNQEIKGDAPYVTTDGSKIAAFNTGQSAPNATLSQTFATTIGQTYQLSFDYGVFGWSTAQQKMQVQVTGSSSLVADTVTLNGIGSGNTKWTSKSYVFTANTASTTLTFTDISTSSTNFDSVLDNVRVGAQSTRSLAITSTSASGANIVVTPADTAGNGSGATGLIRAYNNGTNVTVTAPASLGTDSFLVWQRNGVDLPGSGTTITVTMDANITLNAVYGSNTAPVAHADSYSTLLNTQLVVGARGVLTNDSDPDGSALGAVINAPPLHGSITLNGDGSFTYTPTSGYQGPDSFSYHANDGVLDSNIATVSLSVYANSSELLTNGSFESDLSGWTKSGNLTIEPANPYTPTDGTKLVAFNSGQLTPNGALSQSFATVPGQVYKLNFDMGAFGYNTNTESLRVLVDGSSNLLTQTFTVPGIGGGNTKWLSKSLSFTANSSTTTLTFRDVSSTGHLIDLVLDRVSVTGAPAARTLTVEALPSSNVTVGVSPQDSNSLSTGATGFTRSYVEGAVVNLSAPAFSGASAFLKWLKNGADFGTDRSVSVTINADTTLTAVYGNNNPPVAVDDSYPVVEGMALNVAAPGVLGNDSDTDSNTLVAIPVTTTAHGTLTLNPDGGFIYTPVSGYTGPDSFTYRANDGSANSNTATVDLNVAPLAPGTLVNGGFEAGEAGWTMSGNRVVIDTQAPYTPTEGTHLMVFNGSQSTPNAVISQSFNTTPGQAYILLLDMGIVGATNTQQRLQVDIAGSASLVSVIETITGGGVATSKWQTKSYSFVADSASTTLTLTDKSTSTSGVDLLLDNVHLDTGSAKTLTINSAAGSVPVTVSPADVNTLGNGTTGFTRLYASGTEVTLDAPASFAGGAFLKWQKDAVDFSGTPGTTVTVDANTVMNAVYAPNSIPVATDDNYSLEMDSSLDVTAAGVLSNDTDADLHPLTAAVVAAPTHGALTLNSDGGFTYTPASGYSGPDSFTYRANDGFANSNTATVSLTVNPFASGNLVNGSFENDETGWTVTGNRVVVEATAPYLPTDGNKLMVANAGNNAPNAVMSQSFATTIGKTYILKLDMGIVGATSSTQRLRVTVTGATQLFSQQEIISGGGLSTPKWQALTYTFVADSNLTTLSLTDQSTTGNTVDLLIDNVRCNIRTERTLTVNTVPDAGLAVSVSPADLESNANGTSNFTRKYDNGTVVTVTAPLTAGPADFLKWTKDGVDFSTNAAANVTMDANHTLTAVYGINHAPVAAANSYQTDADTVLNVSAPGILANDQDQDGTPITAVLDTTTSHGTLALNANGGFTYTPDAGYTGGDSFTYHAFDGSLSSAVVTVSISVQSIATGALVNGSFEDGEAGWTVSGNRVVIDSTPPYTSTDGMKLMVFNGSQSTPNALISQTIATTPGQTYTLAFDMGVVGVTSAQQRLQIAVTGNSTLVSQTETLTGIGAGLVQWAAKSYTFTADSTSTTIGFADASTTGVNIDLLLDNVRIKGPGTHSLIVNSSAGRGLSIDVSPLDLASHGGGLTNFERQFADGASVTLTAPPSYGGGDFLKWKMDGADIASTQAVVVSMDADHTLTAVYTSPPQLLVNGSFEDDYNGWTHTGNQLVSSAYPATNGLKVVELNGTQLTPNAVLSQAFPTVPGQTYQLTFDLGVIAYNTNLQRTYVSVTGNSTLLGQTVSIQGQGGGSVRWLAQSFQFTADSATSTLVFRDTSTTSTNLDMLLDNVVVSGDSVLRTLTVASSPSSGAQIMVSPADTDSLSDGTSQFTRNYENGATVSLSAPAMFGGMPFSKWQKDGADLSGNPSTSVLMDANHTLTAVYAPNQAPVASANSYSVQVDQVLTVTSPGVLANDTDADADTLTAVVETLPSHGTLSLNSNGGFTYTPDSGYEGSDSFTYHANDGLADSNAATVSISIVTVTPGVLVNGSFEDGETGWTMSGNRIVVDSATPYLPTDGNRLMVFNGSQQTPNAVISQTFATTPGESYAIDFDMGIIGATNSQQRLQFDITGNTTLVSQLETINGGGTSIALWIPKSYSFVADSASTTLTFSDQSLSTGNVDLLIDRVRVTTGTARTLTFNTNRSGPVTVTVSPADLGGDSSGDTTFTRSYDTGTTLNLSAPSTVGADTFHSWEKNGVQFSTTTATTLTVGGNDLITAVYIGGGSAAKTLTVQSTPNSGAAITVSPSDLSSQGNGSTQFTRSYNTGTVVTLTAPASSGGGSFIKWQLDGVDLTTNASATVTMNSAHTATAVYSSGLLVNGSFEDGLTGWTTSGNSGTVKTNSSLPATDGVSLVEFNSANTANNGVLTQTISTTPGTTYKVFFDMGVLAFNTNPQKLEFNATGNGSLFTQTYTLNGTGGGNYQWVTQTANFTANSSSTVLTFKDKSSATNAIDLWLDNVRVVPNNTPITLTIASSPTGVPITVSPSDQGGDSSGTAQFTRTYNIGTSVSLTAPATYLGAPFVKWRKNGNDLATTNAVTVVADSNSTYSAVYAASTGLVSNGSFELGLTGWTVSGTTNSVKANTILPATDGVTLVEINSSNTPNDGVLSQTFNTTPGTTYDLTFDLGVLAYNTSQQRMKVEVNGAGNLLSQITTINGNGAGTAKWESRAFSFVANSASTTLILSDVSTTTSAIDMLLDNVKVLPNASVPVQRVLSVASTGISSVAVTVSPSDVSGNSNGTTSFSRYYSDGTAVTLTAPASSGTGTFTKWQKNGADLTTNTSATVTMDGSHTLTAVYSVPPPTPLGFSNGSFESGLTNWTVGGTLDAAKVNSEIPTTNGTNLIEFNSANRPNDGTIAQTFTTTPGGTYTVTFDMGVLAFNTNQQKMEASVTGTGTLASQIFAFNGIGGGNIKWNTYSLNFTADAATTTLTFRDRSTTTLAIDLLLDNVRVTSTGGAGLGPNRVVNGSFESDFSGWTTAGGTYIEKPGPSLSTSGNNILSFGVGNAPPGGYVSQTFATVPGTTYQITYDVGVLGYNTKVMRLNMLLTGSGTLLDQTTSVTCRPDFVMVWTPQLFTFVANSTTTTLKFTDVSADGTNLDVFLDTVSVNSVAATIPQPEYAETPQYAPESSIAPIESATTPGGGLNLVPTLSGAPGDMRIQINATETGLYILEKSEDLKTWNPQSAVEVLQPGPVEFHDNETGAPRMFYRIGKQTD